MIELLEQQKKLTTNQWKLICTANLADLLDFFDFFLIGYVTAALTKQWSLTYWEGGGILLASGLGAVPGAVIVPGQRSTLAGRCRPVVVPGCRFLSGGRKPAGWKAASPRNPHRQQRTR